MGYHHGMVRFFYSTYHLRNHSRTNRYAGEYITTSAKLQVAHPPGAPLLQMIGAFFAMFALEPSEIARMVNYVSGVSSAFTIL